MEQFSIFVESLKRLYKDKKITENKIISLFADGKLTEKEKEYILNQ
jgi:hypothetical protein